MKIVNISAGYRPPFAAPNLFSFLAARVIPGIERADVSGSVLTYQRSARLAHGAALLGLRWADNALTITTVVEDAQDDASALALMRRLADLDADPEPISTVLSRDPLLRPLVAACPGLRVPGCTDPDEIAIRAVLGQQISVARAASLAAGLVDRYGERLPSSLTAVQRADGIQGRSSCATAPAVAALFPTAAALAAVNPATLPMPRARGRALVGLAASLASEDVLLEPGADAGKTRASLLALPGIGPWTADYILLRGVAAPDILLSSDLIIRRELERRGLTDVERTANWSPWRSYATMHLWRASAGISP